MRRGELIGLRWKDVDLSKPHTHVLPAMEDTASEAMASMMYGAN